jgi:hypothetical protein
MGLDRLDALLGVGLCLVTLTGGDDFAIRGLQVEPVFAGVILRDLKYPRPFVGLTGFEPATT